MAGLSTRLLYLLGQLYGRSNYVGLVDVGLAVTGIGGAITVMARNSISYMRPPPFDEPQYKRSRRVSALTLIEDARSVSQKLIMPLVLATTQGRYDPFRQS